MLFRCTSDANIIMLHLPIWSLAAWIFQYCFFILLDFGYFVVCFVKTFQLLGMFGGGWGCGGVFNQQELVRKIHTEHFITTSILKRWLLFFNFLYYFDLYLDRVAFTFVLCYLGFIFCFNPVDCFCLLFKMCQNILKEES